jgi:hypothetical protein
MPAKLKIPDKKLLVIITIVLTIAIWLVGMSFPNQRLWGINHLAYFSIKYSLAYIALMLIAYIILIDQSRSSNIAGPKRILLKAWRGIPRVIKVIFSGILALCLFYIFRDKALLLGDAILRVGELQDCGLDRLSSTSAAEPLDFLIHYGIFHYIFVPLKLNSTLCYQVISYIAGLIYIGAAWSFAGYIRTKTLEQWLVFSYLLGWGGTMMFFGYAEEYGLAAAALMLFIYSAAKYIKSGKGIIALSIIALVCFFLHNLLIVIFPAIFYLFWQEFRHNKRRALATALVNIVPVLLWMVYSYSRKESGAFLLFESGTEPGYFIWSGAHIVDIVNQLFLVCPPIMVMSLLQRPIESIKDKNNRLRRVIWLVALASLAVLILVDPQLSMYRDWDLFALPLLSLHVALFLGVDWSKVNRSLKIAIAVIAVGTTGLWVQINASTEIALSRYQSQLPLDFARGRYGYQRLGVYYMTHNRLEEAEAAYKNAIAIKPHARSYINLGLVQARLNKKDDAIASLKKSLELVPNQAAVLDALARLYYETERYEEALDMMTRLSGSPGYADQPGNQAMINNLQALIAAKNSPAK